MLANGGKCVYCDIRKATAGDHIKPLKKYADEVNSGLKNFGDAVKESNSIQNIAGACRSCNSSKGAKDLGESTTKTTWAPPNKTDIGN